MTDWTLADAGSAIVLVAVAWFTAVHSITLLSVVAVYARLRGRRRREQALTIDAVAASRVVPGISIVVAAGDGEASIVERIRTLLLLEYPRLEVVVVSEGPADRTLAGAAAAFDLVRVPSGRSGPLPPSVTGVHRSLAHPGLVVLEVAGADRTAAIDAGIGVARHPLVCLIDSGALVEAQALTRAVQPFLRWPDTIASAGGVRIANGGTVDEGRGVRLRLPASRLATLQIVERLRAEVPGKVHLSAVNGLVAIPAAFGLYSREALTAAGGVGRTADGGDVDLALRLHRAARRWRRRYRLVFLPDPVCWVVVPERWTPLALRVRRRQEAVLRALLRHRSMMLNPRFGALGLLVLPAALTFEALGPLVETAGYAAAVAGLAAGVLDPVFAELLFLSAIVYGTLVSVAAVLFEELTSDHDAGAADLVRLACYGMLENLGYRQATAWWRLRGVAAAVGRRARRHPPTGRRAKVP